MDGKGEEELGSQKGLTKQCKCSICGADMTISLYANASNIKCDDCTTKSTSWPTAMEIPPAQSPGMINEVFRESDPVKIQLVRNRQEIEGLVIMDDGRFIERVPTEWKARENKLDYLSVSKIEAYAGKYGCPAKFHYIYMSDENTGEDGGNIFTWFGSIMHEVVELASKYYRDSGIIVNPIQLYDDAWKSRCLTDLGMYREGRVLIQDYFNRNPVDKRYDTCVAVELEWRGQFGGGEFGFMADYIGEINPVTGLLKDYKTNRQPYTPWDLENSLQLQVYEAIFRRALELPGRFTINGEDAPPSMIEKIASYKEWVTGYELFKFGWQPCPHRTLDDLEAIEAYVANVYHQILNDNTWEEKLNHYCGYCPRASQCKKYCDIVNNPGKYIDTIQTAGLDIEQLNENRKLLAKYEKICGDRKKIISDMLTVMIEKATIEQKPLIVGGGTRELQLYAQSKSNYRYYDTRNMLIQHGRTDILSELESCLSINKAKFDAILSKYPDMAMILSNCMDTSYSSSYIVEKKPKKGK